MTLFKRIRKHPAVRRVSRYALPFVSILGALFAQGIVQHFVPARVDFPYAFFYLIAAFVSAWYGGYVAGVLACLFTMVGLPLLVVHFSQMPPVDVSRLLVFAGVSLFVSRVAQTQRRAREVLRTANENLDRRVQEKTAQLARAVDELRAEVAGHQKTEAALRDSEERIAFALDAAGMGHWDLDLATGKIDRSPRHDQILAYDALQPEWTYQMLLDHILPDDRAVVARRFDLAMQGGTCEFECRVKPADQPVRWLWVRCRVRRDASGQAAGLLGIVADVTSRMQAEQKLRAQVERLSMLDQITRAIGQRQDLHSIFQVVVRTLEDSLPIDFGCVCLYHSADETLTVACEGILSEAMGKSLAMTRDARVPIDENGLSRCVRGQLVYEPDVAKVPFPFPQRLANAGLRAMVVAPLLVESQVFGILVAARRAPDSFSSGECEFLRQLSEHVALAAHEAQVRGALQQAYDDLRQTQQAVMQQERLRALGQMASGIAHDINNALSPMALYTESLLEREPNLSQRTREYLEIVQRSIEDVTHTVGRMREFSRQREPQLMLVAVDPNRLAQQVLDMTRARWSDMPQQRGIVIHAQLELAEGLPAMAGIESEIREALINLVFNAVDAMPDGGTLTLRTKATGSPAAQWVQVEVADTGIGMDEQTRRRCLEPFFTTKGDRGTGLGLAMVYGVAQRMNAEIAIESIPGKGTTMRMSFPARNPAGNAPPLTYVTTPSQRLRLLVVDDDPLIIKSLCDALEGDGHAVTAAHGGQEGINLWRAAEQDNQSFALVITDLGMPYVDGRKVASTVKATCPRTPVIMLTGWGQRMAAGQELPANVDRVLNKPPKLHELRTALKELVPESQGDRAQVPMELAR